MNHRTERVGNLIQQELGKLIQREIEFPGALVTITDVVIDKKMEGAKVMVSVLPKNKTAEALDLLDKSAAHLQHLLLKKINIKPMPRIKFEIDFGAENAAAIEKLLTEEGSSESDSH
ncbi:MAG: 30S ribosome-binding factor RbfA [Patescibacteria group bacterium]